MIFPALTVSKISQIGERVFFDARKTFANGGDEILKIEIQPNGTGPWVEVDVADPVLIWAFDVAGDFTASVRVNDTEVKTYNFTVVTPETDKLFSSDSDIIGIESEILDYLNEGRSTHNDKHREAQRLILEELNARGVRYWDDAAKAWEEITKANILRTKELNAWSRLLTLSLIYFDVSKSQDSIFWEKAKYYEKSALAASQDRQFLKVDLDGDGIEDENDEIDFAFTECTVVRR